MKAKRLVLIALGLTLFLSASMAAAQSLGDLARAQRERRSKEAKQPVKTYTNENMPARPPGEGPTAAGAISESSKEGPSGAQPESGSAMPEGSAAKPPTQTKPPEAAQEKPEDKKRTREYWQGKFKAAREQIAKAEEEQRLAEDELSLLQIQQARELNTQVINELGAKVNAKIAELDSKRATTNTARKALEALEKLFKESDAPADWSKTE